LPASISISTIRRRTGWFTTDSASRVVNPVPVKADRAWKRAVSRESPVAISATVATRVTINEMRTTTSSEAIASTSTLYPRSAIV
jgi:hypothetical protein